jgi:anti-sigma factor ChrR (cupin superfamily)
MNLAAPTSCAQSELTELFAIGALSAEMMASQSAHLATCETCSQRHRSVLRILAAFRSWPVNDVDPSPELWSRLEKKVGGNPANAEITVSVPEPQWEEPAPGIHCKLLSSDREFNRVTMIVRLDPGTEYPPHTHAGIEELHLLDGELWIDDRKLFPGDYNRAEPGSSDARVWSETGCTCVLITSPSDVLR